ncbi:MAG TPA: hypothetical protein VIN07_02810 [Flavipsychrobacter sp.]
MKRYLIALLIPLAVAGCKETDSMVNELNNQKMRDSLKKTYPSLQVSQIRIEVKEFRDVEVLLGDKELYSQPDEQLREVTRQIAELTYHLYNENNYLDEGKVIFIENERTAPGPDEPKREFDMHLETFKK